MEWTPNQEGVKELVKLFKESQTTDNNLHRIVFEKINTYSTNKEFTNYLLFILNSDEIEDNIRQLSGLTLKGILERQFHLLEPDAQNYFKNKILQCYLHPNEKIRKTISNLINTFLQHIGLSQWPEILGLLFSFLDHQVGASISLETLIIILEDNAKHIEEHHSQFLISLIDKLFFSLVSIDVQSAENKMFQPLIILVLKLIIILLEHLQNYMLNRIEALNKSLLNLTKIKNLTVRILIGKCWNALFKMKTNLIEIQSEDLFIFFNSNIFEKNYELNLTASEFYLFIVSNEINFFKDKFKMEGAKNIKGYFESTMQESFSMPDKINFNNNFTPPEDFSGILKLFYNNCKLSQFDLCQVESENKEFKAIKHKFDLDEDNEEDDDLELEELQDANFTKDWSLRKCSALILEKLSQSIPDSLTSIIIPLLEKDVDSPDWLVKERSIFVLGSICIGSINVIKPNLHNLTKYLIGELGNTNKLIRATTCYTLSKLSDFIMNSSDEALLKLYLSELLKRFLDTEPIVQETACRTFNTLVKHYKEKLAPYLGDIYQIINSIFETYSGTSLMTLYDCLVLLTENYPDSFLDLDLVCELLYGILGKWCSFTATVKEHQEKSSIIPLRQVTSPNFFDLVIAVFKISFEIFFCHFDDFFNGCLMIIELYPDDREIVCRCMDLISVIMQNLPNQFINNSNREALLILIKNVSKLDDELGYKQFALALIGDICKVEPELLNGHFDDLMQILLENLSKLSDKNTISICNNCCWTINVLSSKFKERVDLYFDQILTKLVFIFSTPKLNKSLAQNAAICLGRMGIVNSNKLSQYFSSVSKQFCLSMKLVNDSQDKEEAFYGFCEALIKNPNGMYKNFAFFCDTVCSYLNPPANLELLFQNIFSSYKTLLNGELLQLINTFPEKLRFKMKKRFPFL